MSRITTHILDVSRGSPAGGVGVVLERSDAAGWTQLGRGATDADGRLRNLMAEGDGLQPGVYRLTFDTGGYFRRLELQGFYPEVQVVFTVRDGQQHYHVPLLLSPFGYSTYRGS